MIYSLKKMETNLEMFFNFNWT